MKIRCLPMTFLILLASCDQDSEPKENDDPLFFLLKRLETVENAKNRIYHDARKLIIAVGWMPLQTNRK